MQASFIGRKFTRIDFYERVSKYPFKYNWWLLRHMYSLQFHAKKLFKILNVLFDIVDGDFWIWFKGVWSLVIFLLLNYNIYVSESMHDFMLLEIYKKSVIYVRTFLYWHNQL